MLANMQNENKLTFIQFFLQVEMIKGMRTKMKGVSGECLRINCNFPQTHHKRAPKK